MEVIKTCSKEQGYTILKMDEHGNMFHPDSFNMQ